MQSDNQHNGIEEQIPENLPAESTSVFDKFKYFQNIIAHPLTYLKERQYQELDENLEQSQLFFSNQKQRKEESIRLLKDWAQNRMDVFDKNREIVEVLANSVDIQIRQSVDYLQIIYRYFNEKYYQEQQYAQFLLTKPQPAMQANIITEVVSLFEQDNLSRSAKMAQFAHNIQANILKGEVFQEFAELDKRSDILLNAIVIQKKLLQNYISSAAQKLNKIIPLIPPTAANNRQRKPIFDAPEQKQTDKILANIATIGGIFLGTTHQMQDPVEAELNSQLEQQEKEHKLKLQQQQQVESQSISSGNEDNQAIDAVKDEIIKQEENSVEIEQQVQSENADSSTAQQVEQSNENKVQLTGADAYKQQQQQQAVPTKQALKTKNYQITEQPQQQQQQEQQQSQTDLYKLISTYISTQQQVIKVLNQLADKVLQYWRHAQIIEAKRAQWATLSCQIYRDGVKTTYGTSIDIPELKIQSESHYSLIALVPNYIKQQNEEEFLSQLIVQDLACQSAKLLLVKEFKVICIDKQQKEVSGYLVVTIDKFVGCWIRHDDEVLDIEHPVFHLPIKGLVLQPQPNCIVDVMPQTHLLFLNIANDRQKTRLRFICHDDMEEFCTIIQCSS